MFQKIKDILKKEIMLTAAVIAAAAALFITPPSKALLADIDWRTLGTLFMMPVSYTHLTLPTKA